MTNNKKDPFHAMRHARPNEPPPSLPGLRPSLEARPDVVAAGDIDQTIKIVSEIVSSGSALTFQSVHSALVAAGRDKKHCEALARLIVPGKHQP